MDWDAEDDNGGEVMMILRKAMKVKAQRKGKQAVKGKQTEE